MSLDLSDAERNLLLEILDERHTSMLHELHHTDTYEYKQILREKIDLLEKLRQKLRAAPVN
ncbi:MAG: hypothetical protein C5B55_07815 [Blastocatellia bacterium]|nr:MAG: hypothetical protein C5B55_07815 [Blastocatellia bacterium]